MISRASYQLALAGLIFVLAARVCPQQLLAETTTTDANLFYLSVSSDLAVVGKVIDSRGIGKRLSKEQISKIDDLMKTVGGSLYTIQVEETLIKRSDLGLGESQYPPVNGKLFLFKKRDGPYFPNELYARGQRYLIFLSAPNQANLRKEYMLDSGQTYYQASDPVKGIVQISSSREPFLLKLRQLGEAVRPSDQRQKLQRLKALSRSSDPEIRQSAVEAIKLIEKSRR
jgi:hypothetical protein